MEHSGSSLPVIEIEARTESGSSANRRLRSQNLIPSIVYHRGEASIRGVLVYNQFIRLAGQSTSSQVFSLKSQDKHLNGRTCLVKDVQKEHLGGRVLHVNLQSLKDDEEITVRVPVRIKGEATGVKNEGGILTVSVHDVGVTCFPKQIPSELIVDVTELKLNKSIHASDLALPLNVKLHDDPHETIVSVVTVRVVEEVVATPTPEEAAAAAAAAGATPAAAGGAAAPGAAAGATPAAGAAGDKKEKKK